MSIEKIKVDSLDRQGVTNINMEFPSNSKTKVQEEPINDKKVKRIVTGKVVERKKSFGKKFAELITGEDGSDMNSVVSYVIRDILLPNIKSMVYDVITGGVEMKLFGTANGKRNRGSRSNGGSSGRTWTSYNSMSSSSSRDDRDRDRDREANRKSEADRNRARHNFDDIILETRGEAEEVLDSLISLVESDYGVASIADLYTMVNIPGNFTDNKFGWDDLRDAKVRRVRDGWLIDLPKAIVLN